MEQYLANSSTFRRNFLYLRCLDVFVHLTRACLHAREVVAVVSNGNRSMHFTPHVDPVDVTTEAQGDLRSHFQRGAIGVSSGHRNRSRVMQITINQGTTVIKRP